MLIGAYGRFWDRELVDWNAYGWSLLGRRGIQSGTIQICDFRRARGVYVLYNEVGVYYAGLAQGQHGIGGRLKDHLEDHHGSLWTRFTWFSFDKPEGTCRSDGVLEVEQYDSVEVDTPVLIRDLEALLQVAMQPFANKSETRFNDGDEWLQVATKTPQIRTFESLKVKLKPPKK